MQTLTLHTTIDLQTKFEEDMPKKWYFLPLSPPTCLGQPDGPMDIQNLQIFMQILTLHGLNIHESTQAAFLIFSVER